MDQSKQAQVEISLHWHSEYASHTDTRFFERINFWRDFFPGTMAEMMDRAEVGETVSCKVDAGDLMEPYNRRQVYTIREEQFRREVRPGLVIEPRVGRFYPRSLVSGVKGFYAGDHRPLRIIGRDDHDDQARLIVDLNHPLAGRDAVVEARTISLLAPREERGGVCNDIPQLITSNGPGMQAPLKDVMTEFYSGEPFRRLDERDDSQFYTIDRLVPHVDRTASEHIGNLYGDYLQPGMKVLDLMSSWTSHIPEIVSGIEVTGVGMNENELLQNRRLNDFRIHDLNREPELPFNDQMFDIVLCTVSVEYLIHPVKVFREVSRVLKPGSPFVVTFSDRWFPTKAIHIWTEMHAFERLGLVLDYFRQAGGFVDLATDSRRGWPRPQDDAHANEMALSDPVFSVRGYTAS